jgi:hypothetical protein
MPKNKPKKKTKKKPSSTKKQVRVIPVYYTDPTDGLLLLDKALLEGDFKGIDTQLDPILKNIPSDSSDIF